MEPVPKLIRREYRLQLVFFAGLLVILFLILLAVPNMLVSFLLAFVIHYLVSPGVNYLERVGLSRNSATFILFCSLSLLLVGAIYWLTPLIAEQFATLRLELPSYIEASTKIVADSEKHVNDFLRSFYTFHLSETANKYFFSGATRFFEAIPSVASRTLTILLLAPFFAYFMLVDGRGATHTLLRLVPNNLFELFVTLLYQINRQMGLFIRARLLESFIVGFVIWLGLSILNFPYATVLALFAAAANLIPYIGPIIGAAPAFIVALVNQDPKSTVLILGVIYSLAQLIDMAFIIPLVVARVVNLHPVTVVIAIIIGSELMGVIGMIISIPVASAIKVTTSAIYEHLMKSRI